MFGLFRRKPKYTGQQILEQLGESAKGIVSAAEESSEVMIGLKGAALSRRSSKNQNAASESTYSQTPSLPALSLRSRKKIWPKWLR
jgi:hypothetical protein